MSSRAREDLLVAVRPAEAGEVVDQRVGQVALSRYSKTEVAPWRFESRALSEPEDQRHVRELAAASRRAPVEENLARGVGERGRRRA